MKRPELSASRCLLFPCLLNGNLDCGKHKPQVSVNLCFGCISQSSVPGAAAGVTEPSSGSKDTAGPDSSQWTELLPSLLPDRLPHHLKKMGLLNSLLSNFNQQKCGRFKSNWQEQNEEIWDEHYMVLFSLGIHSGIPGYLLDSVPSSDSFLCKSLQTPSNRALS